MIIRLKGFIEDIVSGWYFGYFQLLLFYNDREVGVLLKYYKKGREVVSLFLEFCRGGGIYMIFIFFSIVFGIFVGRFFQECSFRGYQLYLFLQFRSFIGIGFQFSSIDYLFFVFNEGRNYSFIYFIVQVLRDIGFLEGYRGVERSWVLYFDSFVFSFSYVFLGRFLGQYDFVFLFVK